MILTRILLPGFVIHSFKYRKVAAWAFSSFDGKSFFFSFLVLCEHPGSCGQLLPETGIWWLRVCKALLGHPLSSGYVFLCMEISLKASLEKTGSEHESYEFFSAQLAGRAIPANRCACI